MEGQMLQIVLFYLFVNCPFPTCKYYVSVEVRRKPIFLSTKKKTACVADLSQSKAKQVVHSEPLNIKAKSPDLTLSNRVVVILFPLSFILRYEGWRWVRGWG
jgi:hypothetical protein